jgi:hypothetical protein
MFLKIHLCLESLQTVLKGIPSFAKYTLSKEILQEVLQNREETEDSRQYFLSEEK